MRRLGLTVAVLLGILVLPGTASAAAISVTTTNDVAAADGACSLREAVSAANSDNPPFAGIGECAAGGGTDTIEIPAGTYKLTIAGASENANATGDLDVTSSLTLAGAGAGTTVLDANRLDRVLDVAAGKTVTVQSLTVTGGRTPDGANGTPASGTTGAVSGTTATGQPG